MTRRAIVPVVMAALMVLAMTCSADAWEKFVSEDGTFSVHYPAGWMAFEGESVVVFEAGDGRQILIMAVPYEAGKSAYEHALVMLNALAEENPGLEADNWQVDEAGDVAYAEVTFVSDGVSQASDITVIRDVDSQSAVWFSYSGPAAGYDRLAAVQTLQGVMESVADGDASQPPVLKELAVDQDEVIAAFLFVVEMTMGQPFTVEAGRTITAEVRRVWDEGGFSEDFSEFVTLARILMVLEGEQLDELVSGLREAMSEWLVEHDADDPVVRTITESIVAAQEVIAPGPPQLTTAAAQSRAELLAFAMTLHTNPAAELADLSHEWVGAFRDYIVANWAELDESDHVQTVSAPVSWALLRHALRFGSAEQSAQVREMLVALGNGIAAAQAAAAQREAAPAGGEAEHVEEWVVPDDFGKTCSYCGRHVDDMTEEELREHNEARQRVSMSLMTSRALGLPNPNSLYGIW